MSRAIEESGTHITLGHAADILGRRRQEIDILVRREKLVTTVGKRGKGGQLWVDLSELPDLEAAAELFDLKIPPKAIREMFSRRSKDALRITVVYRKGDMHVLEDPSAEKLSEIANAGATIKTVDFPSLRRFVAERLDRAEQPVPRGRPKMDRESLRAGLEATAQLGEDEISDEAVSELIGLRRSSAQP